MDLQVLTVAAWVAFLVVFAWAMRDMPGDRRGRVRSLPVRVARHNRPVAAPRRPPSALASGAAPRTAARRQHAA